MTDAPGDNGHLTDEVTDTGVFQTVLDGYEAVYQDASGTGVRGRGVRRASID